MDSPLKTTVESVSREAIAGPFRSRHAGRDPASRGGGLGTWIPAFAGMTEENCVLFPKKKRGGDR